MSIVDAEFALWLRSEESAAISTDAVAAARWGTLALDTTISSALALKPDADAEASRQLAFVGGPVAVERLWVQGNQIDLIGRVVKLTADKGGYGAGLNVFVLFADEAEGASGGTLLTVLRRL